MKLVSSIILAFIIGFIQIDVVFPFNGYILKSTSVLSAHIKPLTPIRIVRSNTVFKSNTHFAVQGSIDDSNGSDKPPFFLNPAFQSKVKIIIPVAIVGVLGYLAATSGFSIDIPQLLESAVTKIEGLGPLGYLYFAGVCN